MPGDTQNDYGDSDVPFNSDQFAAYLITAGLADNSVRAYRCLYQRWLDHCAALNVDPDALDPHELRAWSRTIHGSRAMLAQARATIGHHADMIGVPRPDGAIPVPRAPRRRTDALSDAQAGALEAAAHTAGIAGTAVLMGLYTAARRSEIAGMEWVHVKADTIRWWRPKVKDWHTVPLHPKLAAHLEVRRGDGWVFPGRWGGHVSPAQVGKWTEMVAERAGIGHVTPKQLRSTALTIVNDATGDLRATADLAGHTNVQTTMVYTRVSQDRLANVVSMLNYRDTTEDSIGGTA